MGAFVNGRLCEWAPPLTGLELLVCHPPFSSVQVAVALTGLCGCGMWLVPVARYLPNDGTDVREPKLRLKPSANWYRCNILMNRRFRFLVKSRASCPVSNTKYVNSGELDLLEQI